MGTSGGQVDALLVATCESCAFVRVKGKGSIRTSSALKRFLTSTAGKGHREFVFDMGECRGMDSTFMGVLAGFVSKLKTIGGGRMMMVNVNDGIYDLLHTLGLDKLIETDKHSKLDPELMERISRVVSPAKLDISEENKTAAADTVLAAHEALAEISPENHDRFSDVIAFLRKEHRHNDTR